ncbi:kinase-like domain-containing protein [Xylaria sp. FL0043]|nr:kinase-like domain-containing protein [Xylaria sp. FL0043]
MAEIAGTALAAVSVGDPLIKAIRGLRRVYRATKNASDSLVELEHTGNTICIYLSQLDDDVGRNPSKCTSVFSQWLEDEKKVLTHSATEIKDFTCKVQNNLRKSTILGGVAYAMEESEIWKIQNRLASHISILEGMRRICENESIDSRVAALELSESKKLRARTTSSLEACSEYWCNVSSSVDETCSVDNESSYQEVLMKSKSYTRAAMRQLMSPSNISVEPLVLDTTLTEREVTSTSWEDVNHVLAGTSDESIKADPQSLQPLHSHERSSIYQSTLQLTTSSTHSSSSQRQDSSAYSGWSIQDTAASISTPMTTQSDGSFNGFGFKAQRHRNKLSVKVEVEGFGSRLVELDELGRENLYDQVICVISTLREDILQSINKSQLKPSLRPKEQGIITYQTSEESEDGLTLLFNKGFLAGAVEALNNGDYTRLTVFATFVLSELDEEQDQTPYTILHKLKADSNKKTQWDSVQFPSIDTILKLANQPRRDPYAINCHISSTLKWAFGNSAEFTYWRRSMPHLMHGGPEWAQKQAVAEGGSSIVYRVKLFKSHQLRSRGSAVYALKEYKQGHEHTFRREVEAYTQLAPRNHPHIMSLLMAYELGGRFHLLFSWASGSLAYFFQYCDADPDPETTSWMGLQCAGLADALQMIHTTSSNVPLDARTEQQEVNYSRHGDLKPENILWFKDSSRGLGALRITDLGVSRLHRLTTEERNSSLDKRFVGTLAYSAPDHIVSSKYDMWSLGIVLTEFVCWLLGGQESVKEFHHARCTGGDGRGYLTDKDGSVRLHPSLSDPRSWARSITRKRRLEWSNASSANIYWQECFLDVYCHVIQCCLDLDLRQRPSAQEVAQALRTAVSHIQVNKV